MDFVSGLLIPALLHVLYIFHATAASVIDDVKIIFIINSKIPIIHVTRLFSQNQLTHLMQRPVAQSDMLDVLVLHTLKVGNDRNGEIKSPHQT